MNTWTRIMSGNKIIRVDGEKMNAFKKCACRISAPVRLACFSLMALAGMGEVGAIYAAQMTDAFADRPVETGVTASFTGDSTSAIMEEGEPYQGMRGRSVWGAWTAPSTGNVTLSTEGSSFKTIIAVYVGTELNGLQPVAYNDDVQVGFDWSRVSFPVKAGETYSFAVDGDINTAAGRGSVQVEVSLDIQSQAGAEVGTDEFSIRPTLAGGLSGIGVGDNRLASVDGEKANTPRGRTLWWRWVCPTNGVVTMDTFDSSFNTILTVYVGDELTSLSEVALNDNSINVVQSRVSFQARKGQEYQVMLDGGINTPAGVGNVILSVGLVPNFDPGAVAGMNDFYQRGLLEGISAHGVANNTYFDDQEGEKDHGSSPRHTTWWQWTAPADGLVDIRTEGSDFNTFLAVYTGSDISSLELVDNNEDVDSNVSWSQVAFNAEHGQSYQIMVDGGVGNISLSINQSVTLAETITQWPAIELEMPGVAGVSYQLQGSDDLVLWDDVGTPVLGIGEPIRILQPVRNNHKFYRYLALP